MIIKVSGIAQGTFYNQNQEERPQTKFYKPEETKEKVKQDFGFQLDIEIKKLHFEAFV